VSQLYSSTQFRNCTIMEGEPKRIIYPTDETKYCQYESGRCHLLKVRASLRKKFKAKGVHKFISEIKKKNIICNLYM